MDMRGSIPKRVPKPDHPANRTQVTRVPYAYDCGDVTATLYGEQLWTARYGRDMRAWNPSVFVGAMSVPVGAWVDLQVWLEGEFMYSVRLKQGVNVIREGEFMVPAHQRVTFKVSTGKSDIDDEVSVAGGIVLEDVTVTFEATV